MKNLFTTLMVALAISGCGKRPDSRDAKIAELESKIEKIRTDLNGLIVIQSNRIESLEGRVNTNATTMFNIWDVVKDHLDAPATQSVLQNSQNPYQPISTTRKIFEIGAPAITVIEKNNSWWRYSFRVSVKCNASQPMTFSGRVHWLNNAGFKVDDGYVKGEFRPGETKILTDDDLINASVAPTIRSAVVFGD